MNLVKLHIIWKAVDNLILCLGSVQMIIIKLMNWPAKDFS